MDSTDEARIAAGYDIVFDALPKSPTFARIWREHSLGLDYPAGFEHISFLTLVEMRRMAAELRVGAGSTLADLGCGMGGPGLWIAHETGAQLVGVDVSAVALDRSRERAARVEMDGRARFVAGTFAATGLESGSVDGAMTVDAFQYAPDKRAALDEIARILRPDGAFVFACFEMDPDRVAGLPIFGTDPVADYGPLLESAGFDVRSYEETDDWHKRVTATYQAVLDARETLTSELGAGPFAALSGEMTVTLQLQPYRRRVFVSATKR